MIFYSNFLKDSMSMQGFSCTMWCPHDVFSKKRKIFKLFRLRIYYLSIVRLYIVLLYITKVALFIFFIQPSLQYIQLSIVPRSLLCVFLHRIISHITRTICCYYLRPFSTSPSRNIYSRFSLILYFLQQHVPFPFDIPISSSQIVVVLFFYFYVPIELKTFYEY